MDPYSLVQQSIAQNNAWSAQQAQKQMDFQERMSNTAHQREIADLKAAGLNPVLSARLGGASTPSGAMGGTDTSGTSALLELLQMSMETANSAAGAARAAASTVEDNSASDLWQAMKDGNGKEIKAGNVGIIGAWSPGEDISKSLAKIAASAASGKSAPDAAMKAAVTALSEMPQLLKGISSAVDANKFRLLQGMLSLESSAKNFGQMVKAAVNKHISVGGSNNWWK